MSKIDIMGFVTKHKGVCNIIVASTVSFVCGYFMRNRPKNEDYNDLINEIERLKYADVEDGTTLKDHIKWILEGTDSVYWNIPGETKTFGDVLSESMLRRGAEIGLKPDDTITGFMIGVKKKT